MSFLIHPIFLITSLGITYLLFLVVFPYFFNNTKGSIKNASKWSIFIIILASSITHIIGFSIPGELGNRLLHLLGGGVLASYLCFRVVIDTKITITKFQFFAFTILIVTALGVANEIAEYFMQSYTSLTITTNIIDTWLDLIMNTLGTLLATGILTTQITINQNLEDTKP
jgi:hypothetical protein